jgi:hypothetical protein
VVGVVDAGYVDARGEGCGTGLAGYGCDGVFAGLEELFDEVAADASTGLWRVRLFGWFVIERDVHQ